MVYFRNIPICGDCISVGGMLALKKRFLSLEAHQDSFPIEFAFFWSFLTPPRLTWTFSLCIYTHAHTRRDIHTYIA